MLTNIDVRVAAIAVLVTGKNGLVTDTDTFASVIVAFVTDIERLISTTDK